MFNFRVDDILQTINMIKMHHLDIRTVTLSLSLRDCISTDINDSNIKNVPILCSYKDGKLIPEERFSFGYDNYPNGFNGGGAGLLSTVHDYLKFGNMLTNKGKGILSPDAFNELIKKYDTPYYDSPFGLGVHVRKFWLVWSLWSTLFLYSKRKDHSGLYA